MQAVVEKLLEEHGTTYAEAAGITLRDKPSPLYQLLVLTMLSSTRIDAEIAVAAARELFKAGWRTPQRMREATWQQRVDALGRGSYKRYDESTSTKLEEGATWLLETYGGDLRELRPRDHGGVEALMEAIAETPRIGPVGAQIFAREVQDVWPEVAPFFDDRALDRAVELDLPRDPEKLASLAPRGKVAQLAAALVRSGRAPEQSGFHSSPARRQEASRHGCHDLSPVGYGESQDGLQPPDLSLGWSTSRAESPSSVHSSQGCCHSPRRAADRVRGGDL